MKRIIAGIHPVSEALQSNASSIAVIYLLRDRVQRKPLAEIVKVAIQKKVAYEACGRDRLDFLVPDHRHQNVVAITGVFSYLDLETLLCMNRQPDLLLALDQITDPNNFGAIIRSAVALGVDGILTLKNRAVPITHSVVRASAGATEHARIVRITNLARTLQHLGQAGMQIVGLDGDAPHDIGNLDPATKGRVLVVGNENRGLRRLTKENCDHLVRISLPGPISSLNASVAAAIALYECRQKAHRRNSPGIV